MTTDLLIAVLAACVGAAAGALIVARRREPRADPQAQAQAGSGTWSRLFALSEEAQRLGLSVPRMGLAPASADAPKELNRLAAEGFVVLALFDADKYKLTKPDDGRDGLVSEEFGILLERRR